MRCANCSNEFVAGDDRCSSCGNARPRVETAFQDAEAEFVKLRDRYDSRRLSAENFKSLIEAKPLEHDGYFWMIGVKSGKWYRHDGAKWSEADPPLQKPTSPERIELEYLKPTDRNVSKGIMHILFTLVLAFLVGRDYAAYAPEGRLVGEILLAASAAMAAAAAFGARELKPQSAGNLIRAIFASGLLLFVTHISA